MSPELLSPDLTHAVLADQTHLSIPSRPEWIAPTVDFLQQKALSSGVCDEVQAGKIMVALHEALTNSLIHGNLEVSSALKERADDAFASMVARQASDPHYGSRRVTIQVCYDGERCQWVFTDEGPGFDYERALRRLESDQPDLVLASGRGLLLMKAFLDGVQYTEGGRQVVLTWSQVCHKDKRQHLRRPMTQPIEVAPLDSDGRPRWDQAAPALTQNLSENGIAFLQQQLSQNDQVFIRMRVEGSVIELPAQVRRCTSLPGGIFEIGCHFLPAPAGVEESSVPQVAILDLLEQLRAGQAVEDDRRSHPRVSYTQPITIHADSPAEETLTAYGQDLSLGGVKMLASQPIRTGARRLTLLQPSGAPLMIHARILRCVRITEQCYEVGAAFLQAEPVLA